MGGGRGGGGAVVARRQTRGWLDRTLGPMRRGSLRSSIFTLISSAIGPGSLLLPYMFRLVGVPIGILCMMFGAYCTAQSLRFIMTIAHLTGCDSYPSGVAAVLGPSAGAVLGCVTNFVLILGTGSHLKFLTALLRQLLPSCILQVLPANLAAVLVVFPVCAVEDLSSLRHLAMLSPLSLLYVIGLIVSRGLFGASGTGAFHGKGQNLDVVVNLIKFGDGGIWELPRAWSMVLNAVTCQHVAVSVFRQMQHAKAKRVNKVVLRSVTFMSFLYALVGTSGFLSHGGATPENILLAFPPDDKAVSLAQVLVGCTLLVAVPMNIHCVRAQVTEKLPPCASRGLPRTALTALLLLLPVGVSSAFPSISSIVGIGCGFGMVTYMFVIPALSMCALRSGSGGQAVMSRPVSRAESLNDLLLSSPLSTPLLGPASMRMVAPKLESTPRRSDSNRDLGMEIDIEELPPVAVVEDMPEASPMSSGSLPRSDPTVKLRGFAAAAAAALPSDLDASFLRSPSEASEPSMVDIGWSAEFGVSLVALAVGTGLGLVVGTQTLLGLFLSEEA